MDLDYFLGRVEARFGVELDDSILAEINTPRELIDNLATLLRPPTAKGGWTREQIAEVVRDLVLSHLGIRKREYREDARFVKDWLLE
jgi:hypothetical protein